MYREHLLSKVAGALGKATAKLEISIVSVFNGLITPTSNDFVRKKDIWQRLDVVYLLLLA